MLRSTDRLTDKSWDNTNPCKVCGMIKSCTRLYPKECMFNKIYTKLAKYEDTGFDPEDVDKYNIHGILRALTGD